MDLSQFATEAPAARRDGWSPELKIIFLDHLAAKGTVRGACSLAGMSREAAYRLRRRDPLFARAWNAALALARENGTDVLACHAIDGIAEDVWYRGEVVGTRIRHDTRLLLAHLARLDRLVEEHPAGEDAGRFDGLLALIAGAEPPEDLPGDEDGLPFARAHATDEAAERARIAQLHAPDEAYEGEDAPEWGEDDAFDHERYEAALEACAEEAARARLAAAAQWDEWFRRACGRVDEVLGGAEFSAGTVSTLSTSGAETEQEHRHPELVSGSIVPEGQTWTGREMDPETSSG